MNVSPRVKVELSGANANMAHPHAYAFFSSLMLCVFIGFVFAIVAQSYFDERETAVLTLGFLIGGLIFAWLLGSFDTKFGLATASGFGLPILGMGIFVLRGKTQ